MTRLFVCLFALCACLVGAPPAQAQTADTEPPRAYAAPDICPVDPIAFAIVELIAGARDDRVEVTRTTGTSPIILAYKHAARSVTLTTRDGGALRYTLQDDQHAAIAMSVTDADGQTVDAVLAPELAFAYITGRDSGPGKPMTDLPRGLFATILAPGDLPPGPADTIRRLAMAGYDDADQCDANTAKICTSRFNRMLENGFLCAASFGGDQSSCNDAGAARCAWCKCKEFGCSGCN